MFSKGSAVGRSEVRTAEAPVSTFKFVSGGSAAGLDATSPQPVNHDLARQGAVGVGSHVLVNRRDLVSATLNNCAVFSSADLVEQGNTKPLIPLGIDPPAHAA